MPRLRTLLPELERLVVPLAAFLAIRAFSWTQDDAAGRAEGAFLALLTAGVLAAIAALGVHRRRAAPELGWTALLATAAAWLVYQGESRGAVVTLILVSGLAVAAARSWSRYRPAGTGCFDAGVAVPLALALQLLLRGDLLLAPLFAARTLVSLLVLPAVAGWALALLATRFGSRRAVVAGGLAVVLAPGFTVTSTLAVAALAAGTLLSERGQPGAVRLAALAAIVVLPLWQLPLGVLFALAALAVAALTRPGCSSRRLPLLLAAVAAVAVLLPPAEPPLVALQHSLGALALVPAAVAATADRRLVGAGALLTLAAAMVSTTPEGLAAGGALVALGVPVAGTTAVLQRAWTALAVLGTALLGTYPWVRDDPLAEMLALVGWHSGGAAFLTLVVIVVGLGHVADRAAPGRLGRLSAHQAITVAGLLLGWALSQNTGPATVLVDSYTPVSIDRRAPHWHRALEQPGRARPLVAGLVIDTNLTRGLTLAPGTPVAILELAGEDRRAVHTWTLRAGFETAEWAAARSDVAGHYGFRAPAPWISLVAPDGSFFAQRFRARFETGEPFAATALSIRRAAGLPAEVRLVIYRLELRP